MDQLWGSLVFSVFVVGALIGVWGWIVILVRTGPKGLLGYKKVLLSQFESVVVYRNGKFERVLNSGDHWVRTRNRQLIVLDIRPEVAQLEQAIVTSDHAVAAIRYVVRVQITDPKAVVAVSKNYKDDVCAKLQLMVKRIGGERNIRDLCADHAAFNSIAHEQAKIAIADTGCDCKSFEVLQIEPAGSMAELRDKQVGFTSHWN